jgi:hydroxypyruvate isomerase
MRTIKPDSVGGSGADEMTRRQVLQGAGCAAAAATLAGVSLPADAATQAGGNAGAAGVRPSETKLRIKQSLVWWCYNSHGGKWDAEQMCQVAKRLGCVSVELLGPEHWPTVKKHGLTCALAGTHGFVKGMNNPKYQDECIATIRQRIDQCAEAGFPSVITFTGMREDLADDVGARNCVEGYKRIIGHAEKQKVNVCLEMLNSRVNVEMKGHPGYQGDHTEYCIDIIKRVGSERMKLLFDIYHVQIMDGDVITRIRQWKDYIGHVHTAGVPGRGELDDRQEINYPPIMRALVGAGYQGYVGQEFIPTRDAMEGLTEAVRLCDV